jgi:hypothetical protein
LPRPFFPVTCSRSTPENQYLLSVYARILNLDQGSKVSSAKNNTHHFLGPSFAFDFLAVVPHCGSILQCCWISLRPTQVLLIHYASSRSSPAPTFHHRTLSFRYMFMFQFMPVLLVEKPSSILSSVGFCNFDCFKNTGDKSILSILICSAAAVTRKTMLPAFVFLKRFLAT